MVHAARYLTCWIQSHNLGINFASIQAPRLWSFILCDLEVTFITLPCDSLSRLWGTVVECGALLWELALLPLCLCFPMHLLQIHPPNTLLFPEGEANLYSVTMARSFSFSKPEEVFLEHASDLIISDTPPPHSTSPVLCLCFELKTDPPAAALPAPWTVLTSSTQK